jgi:hypothetical protein
MCIFSKFFLTRLDVLLGQVVLALLVAAISSLEYATPVVQLGPTSMLVHAQIAPVVPAALV